MKQAASIHDLKLPMLPKGITVSSSIDYRLHLGKKTRCQRGMILSCPPAEDSLTDR